MIQLCGIPRTAVIVYRQVKQRSLRGNLFPKWNSYRVLLRFWITPVTSVPATWHGCALFNCNGVVIVPIEFDVPPLRVRLSRSDWEVVYASDAPLLRGNWLCGGTLVLQAASRCSGSGQSLSNSGPFVERFVELGRAHPLRLHFVIARPALLAPKVPLLTFSFLVRIRKFPSYNRSRDPGAPQVNRWRACANSRFCS